MRLIYLFSLLLLLALPAMAQEEPCPTDNYCAPAEVDGVQIREETTGFSIKVNYPVLCHDEATRTIRDTVLRGMADFKMAEPGHDLTDIPHKYVMETGYEIVTAAHERLASVKVNVSVYTGGAHSNHWPTTWVFDMADGEALLLDDIFADPSTALPVIAELVQESLYATLGNMTQDEMIMDGTAPRIANFEDFIVTDEGITFFFAPYQVAPFAAGEQSVFLKWSKLDGQLKTTFRDLIAMY